MYPLFSCLCVYMYMCICASTHVYMGGAEVKLKCCSSEATLVGFRGRVFHYPGTHQLAEAGQPAAPRYFSCLCLPRGRITHMYHYIQLFPGMLEINSNLHACISKNLIPGLCIQPSLIFLHDIHHILN